LPLTDAFLDDQTELEAIAVDENGIAIAPVARLTLDAQAASRSGWLSDMAPGLLARALRIYDTVRSTDEGNNGLFMMDEFGADEQLIRSESPLTQLAAAPNGAIVAAASGAAIHVVTGVDLQELAYEGDEPIVGLYFADATTLVVAHAASWVTFDASIGAEQKSCAVDGLTISRLLAARRNADTVVAVVEAIAASGGGISDYYELSCNGVAPQRLAADARWPFLGSATVSGLLYVFGSNPDRAIYAIDTETGDIRTAMATSSPVFAVARETGTLFYVDDPSP
jgi:hypothetical protein